MTLHAFCRDNVFRNFMAWASSHDEDWVDKHVAHYANIAGPTLGVPKAISSFLSGLGFFECCCFSYDVHLPL